ncbi:MAG: adenine deaminase, partial [Paraclostridium sp.]
VASGRVLADKVIKNCRVIDVYNGTIVNADIAIYDNLIAGIGEYEGNETIDAKNKFASPGFIDTHIHIESSYVSPEELGRLIVPHGTTTIIADPHEIANVCGLKGIEYMINASKKTALDIKMMLPSCVPATPFENSGATINSSDMIKPIRENLVFGLGEFMNFPGVVHNDEEVLNKILVAKENNLIIDGHSPSLSGKELNAYASTGIKTDHECANVKDMHERIARGMYVMLRQGSACKDLKPLLKGLTPFNSKRCILCADDMQPKTILSEGHLDNSLRMCVKESVDPIIAIQMATLNAAECYELKDRGAIAPGLRADIVLFDDLENFNVDSVFIEGVQVSKNKEYLLPIELHDISDTIGSFKVLNFSKEKLSLKINSNKAHAIGILPGGVVTKKEIVDIKTDKNNEFIYNKDEDIVKIAVVERHKNTGNVSCALLKGYGIKEGAIALSIAHDSHNIIVVGVNDCDMEFAVEELISQGGGIVLVNNKQVIESMPLPIGGLMSDKSGEWVDEKLKNIHNIAHEVLKVSYDVEPVMTLCFMSLPVIPEIKITDMGLFDVGQFKFISNEA